MYIVDIFWLWADSLCLQTDQIRQESSEDMSISRAISMVFERRPDLRSYLILFVDILTQLPESPKEEKRALKFLLSENC